MSTFSMMHIQKFHSVRIQQYRSFLLSLLDFSAEEVPRGTSLVSFRLISFYTEYIFIRFYRTQGILYIKMIIYFEICIYSKKTNVLFPLL